MTELHAGYRVPPAELDEVPMGNYNPIQNGRPSGDYQRRLDAQNYWTLVMQHRFAVVLGALFIATVIALIGITTYFAVTPDKSHTQIEIEKITEIEYPETEEAVMNDVVGHIGDRIPFFGASEGFSADTLDALLKATYQTAEEASENLRPKRARREVEAASVESCRERHKNCKILLGRVKKMSKNVSQQVQHLHKMINRLGILNEELPSLNNITVRDFATCLRCEKLENETASLRVTDISTPPDSTTKNAEPSPSQVDVHQVETETESEPTTLAANIQHFENTGDVTRENISAVVSPDESQIVKVPKNLTPDLIPGPVESDHSKNQTVATVMTESTIVSDYSSISRNSSQEAPEVVEPSHGTPQVIEGPSKNDTDGEVYFRHGETSPSSGARLEPVELSTLDVTEATSTTTEGNPEASATSSPEEDHESILKSIHSPESKASYEPNPFMLPTAEISKTSQQMTYTPNVSWMPYPLCVYGPPNPPPQSVRQTSSSGSITFPVSSPASVQRGQPLTSAASNAPFTLNFVQPIQPIQQIVQPSVFPVQFQPASVPVQPLGYGPTGPSVQYFPVNQANHPPTATGQGRPLYCTYLPTPTFQFPVVPGVSEFQRAAPEPGSDPEAGDGDGDRWNKFEDQELKSRDYAAGCPPNTRTCNDRSQCIPLSRWCDGEVDCADASDETRCSCRDRVDRERICDGYFDCPLGEDELGCFGCDKRSFSCDDSEDRKRWGNCVPLLQRCDGYADCANGKDEMNCNVITHSVEERDMFTVGYTEGYLHKNWRGKWYPACTPSKPWANDACRAEIGDENYTDFPEVKTVPLRQNYRGPYVVELPNNQVEAVQSCSGQAVYVNCPEVPCGTRVSLWRDDFDAPYSVLQSSPKGLNDYRSEDEKLGKGVAEGSKLLRVLETSMKDESPEVYNSTGARKDAVLGASRVVGGHPSQPRAWPSLVAINRDGNFHCGGVILDEMWVLTAAHCVDSYPKHYYDIQSGILRRFSYSPMEQSRKVSHVVMHPNYDRVVMKNDIALLRLEKPLHFNRWVRPACLPEMTTAGPTWRTGPVAETTCVSAGWGSTIEHGPDPDHLREVELPILANCKYLVDRNEAEICAGMPQGGRDTCQGDSGGPLMCRNPNSPAQWYVAGIVSHGEGCARPNEPGAYTKVSRFVEWINRVRLQREMPNLKPLVRCPGYYCTSGSRRCYSSKRRCDKSVDCLDAEDELHCQRFSDYSSGFNLYKSDDSEGGDFLAATNGQDPSSETTASENSMTTTEPTVGSSSTESSNAESSSTSTAMTTIQTTTEPIETTPKFSATMESDNILNTVATPTTTQLMDETTKDSTTIEPDVISTNVTTRILPPRHFSCKILIQTIDVSKRCDRKVDCQDGTDEEDCTCKDYLAKVYPAAICDGHIDCLDVSDEENCEICSPEEFQCKRSKECVPLSKRCDVVGDCQFNEDELGCLTLTNGKYVITDIDGLPHHNMEGILTSYENGKWVPFCMDLRPNKPATLGKQMCSYFGFAGCESFNETRMLEAPLEVRTSSPTNLIPYEHPLSLYPLETDEEPRCTALYIRCLPTIHTVSLAYRVKANEGDQGDTFLWPWHAAVFVDGRYKCAAVLLEPSWLLTSVHCTDNLDLNEDYIVALLGVSRSYLQVDGPHQQMSPVDEIKRVKNSDAVLLHLKYPANMTRHVQPMYLQKRTHAPAESDTCATVGVDKDEKTRSIFLQAVLHNCPDNHRCYKNVNPKKCENETINPWSGVVVCFGCSGWYPAAVYHEETGPCSFSTKQSFSSIDYINTNLITGMQEAPSPSAQEPKCYGFRCPLGECIESKRLCDGVPDCRDGADENPDYCQGVRDHCANSVDDAIGCTCAQSELRCAGGQCVPKSAFCDGKIDCTDGSDEPFNCTCAAYLRLTTPELICDGRRHCFDKTDESSDSCLCKDASFQCDGSGEVCVPEDFVCDGHPDCPSGEDEKHCQSLRTLSSDSPGYGEVIQRSYGVWHSRCFPGGALSGDQITDKSLTNLCQNSGYSYVKNITESDSLGGPYRGPVVPKIDQFYIVRLNPRTWILMRDDRALVSLHPPQETCYRHYVTCA